MPMIAQARLQERTVRPFIYGTTNPVQWNKIKHTRLQSGNVNVSDVITSCGVSEYSLTRSTATMFVSTSEFMRTIMFSMDVTCASRDDK